MKFVDRLETALVRATIALLRLLSPTAASNLGGFVARGIGPWLPVSRVADDNLRHAFPELDFVQRRRLVRGVWDNLGRTATELPHLPELKRTASGPGWEIEGEEYARALADQGGPTVLVSGHIGNWELLPVAAASFGVLVSSFYRPAANRAVDRILNELRMRAIGAEVPMFPKGAVGAVAARQHLAKGGYLGILQDQKTNEEIAVPFFGRPAMTATVAAAFALRFRCPLLIVHIRRVGPARLRVIVGPPLLLPESGNRVADVSTLTAAISAELEARIRSYPEGWLWLHRRWPKER